MGLSLLRVDYSGSDMAEYIITFVGGKTDEARLILPERLPCLCAVAACELDIGRGAASAPHLLPCHVKGGPDSPYQAWVTGRDMMPNLRSYGIGLPCRTGLQSSHRHVGFQNPVILSSMSFLAG